jgi:hypothetical protein
MFHKTYLLSRRELSGKDLPPLDLDILNNSVKKLKENKIAYITLRKDTGEEYKVYLDETKGLNANEFSMSEFMLLMSIKNTFQENLTFTIISKGKTHEQKD